MNNKEPETLVLAEFSGSTFEPEWQAINDGVMGGESEGGPLVRDGILHFSGSISLANNGGFSSIRGRGQHYDLSAWNGLRLGVKGEGRTYQIRLYTDARFRGSRIAYTAPFNTVRDQWADVHIGFAQLEPVFRGQKLTQPPFDPANVEEIGFLIADKREGPFHLEVDWIKAER